MGGFGDFRYIEKQISEKDKNKDKDKKQKKTTVKPIVSASKTASSQIKGAGDFRLAEFLADKKTASKTISSKGFGDLLKTEKDNEDKKYNEDFVKRIIGETKKEQGTKKGFADFLHSEKAQEKEDYKDKKDPDFIKATQEASKVANSNNKSAITARMQRNSEKWKTEKDSKKRNLLHQENMILAKKLGLGYNPDSGDYFVPSGENKELGVSSQVKTDLGGRYGYQPEKSIAETSPFQRRAQLESVGRNLELGALDVGTNIAKFGQMVDDAPVPDWMENMRINASPGAATRTGFASMPELNSADSLAHYQEFVNAEDQKRQAAQEDAGWNDGPGSIMMEAVRAVPGTVLPVIAGLPLGSLAAAAGTGGKLTAVARMVPFMASAGGGYAQEAAQSGADYWDQATYGAIMGMAEGLTEALPVELALKTVSQLGAKSLVEKGIRSVAGTWLKGTLMQTVSEAAQEAAIEPINNIVRGAIYDPTMTPDKIINLKEMAHAGEVGAVMSLMLAPFGLVGSARSRSYIEDSAANGQAPDPQITAQLLAEDLQDPANQNAAATPVMTPEEIAAEQENIRQQSLTPQQQAAEVKAAEDAQKAQQKQAEKDRKEQQRVAAEQAKIEEGNIKKQIEDEHAAEAAQNEALNDEITQADADKRDSIMEEYRKLPIEELAASVSSINEQLDNMKKDKLQHTDVYQELEEGAEIARNVLAERYKELSGMVDTFETAEDEDSLVEMGTDNGYFRHNAELGNSGIAYTNDNTPIEFQYAIVPAEDLVTSHDIHGNANPNYPQELQPRDRSRTSSQAQVTNIVNNINPELLGESKTVIDGAPIVGPDMVVESGNARAIAIKHLYDSDNDNAYYDNVINNLGRYGINAGNLKTSSPVLVRIRVSNVDRADFARKANESNISAMSASELAAKDAELLSPEVLAFFNPAEDGSLNNTDNLEFIRAFMSEVIPGNEHGKYVTADGRLSQEGLQRIRNAILYKAYNSRTLSDRLFESLDEGNKNIANTLINVAPRVVSVKTGIANGTLYPLDFAPDIAHAAEKYLNLKANKKTIASYLEQLSLVADDISPEARALLSIIEGNSKSAKRMTRVFSAILDGVKAIGNPSQLSLLGSEAANISKGDVINGAIRALENEGEQVSIFEVKPEKRREDSNNATHVLEENPETENEIDGAPFTPEVVASETENTTVPNSWWYPIEDARRPKYSPTDEDIPEIEAPNENEVSARKSDNPSEAIAGYVSDMLDANNKVDSLTLNKVANDAFGGTMTAGTFSVKDMYDALELGVNKYLLAHPEIDATTESADAAIKNIQTLKEMLEKIPTQTKRTEEMEEFQQFSTPPTIAYLANWAANIQNGETYFEPSAGIGGLAVFGKKAGAKVSVNELSKRRLEVIKNLPFERFYNENGEQVYNILNNKVHPSVIVMNPPFSATAGRMEGKRDTKFAKAHVEQALKLLNENGRLVMIVGRGMADNSPSFRDWWSDIKKVYNVRANIGVDGKNYNKYGTSFDIRVIVIDKNGPTAEQTFTAEYTDLADAVKGLEGIRNERTIQRYDGRPLGGEVSEDGEDDTRPDGRVPVSTNGVGNGTAIRPDAGGARPGSAKQDGAGDRGRRQANTKTDNARRNEPEAAGENENSESGGGTSAELPFERDNDRGSSHGGIKQVSGISITNAGKTTKTDDLSEDGKFATYIPQKLNIPGAKDHPGELAQSAAMAAVEPPDPTYTPNLPAHLIENGDLSLAQLEPIVYGGQSFNQMLPDGTRRGFFVGDGTGVGKGRIISGFIQDALRSGYGNGKAVWVSVNDPLIRDAKRDYKALGGNPDEVFNIKKSRGKKGKPDKGILFCGYSTLATKKENGDSTIDEIVKWLGEDFDGIIAFDEAHTMKSAVTVKGARGNKEPAQRALAGIELQNRLPNARVLYVSATGATEVYNLAYAPRLGLWGKGTAFATVEDFISKVTAGGIAAMELVARDMKAMGLYLSRTLSFRGVAYRTLMHDLTKDQQDIYDEMARAWQMVLKDMQKARGETDAKNSREVRQQISQIWGREQAFFNQIITTMQVPTMIKDIEKQLAEGNSAVIQLVNTNEAQQKRAIAETLAEGGDMEDVDLTPRDMLLKFVDNVFPIYQYTEKTDDNGNKISVMAKDSEGNPVVNPEALKMKNELMSRLGSIKVPESPMDIILRHFGVDNVAEITGRSERLVYKMNPDTGKIERIREPMSDESKNADEKAFMSGEKRILIFSDAGGTGRSYHASNKAANKQMRVHYLLQAGWIADKAVQGFGRTHRTDEAQPPEYVLVTTNLRGQKRFISSIARRLDQLGALTKGQRTASGQSMFSEKDNLESALGKDALQLFYQRLAKGIYDKLPPKDVVESMGLGRLLDEWGNLKDDPELTRDMPKFLNRILALEVNMQNEVFDTFAGIFDELLENAIENGTLDAGTEYYKADNVKMIKEHIVHEDPTTGAKTKYVELSAKNDVEFISFDDAKKVKDSAFYVNERSGNIVNVSRGRDHTTSSGSIAETYKLQTPVSGKHTYEQKRAFDEKSNWKKVSDVEAAVLWDEYINKHPKFTEKPVHLITGALLPIWDRLPEGQQKALRVKLENGDVLLGRLIPEKALDYTLQKLGTANTKDFSNLQGIIDKILKSSDYLVLSNGWRIAMRRISNEKRLEILSNSPLTSGEASDLRKDGVDIVIINYKTRFFIPLEDGLTTLKKVIEYRPIADYVTRDEEGAYGDTSAMTAGSRLGQAATVNIEDGIEDVDEAAETKESPVKRQEVIDYIEKNFKSPVKTGHFRNWALGIYKNRSIKYAGDSTIRTKQYGDLSVISHEVGHRIDDLLEFALSKKPSSAGATQELMDLGEQSSRDSYSDKQVRMEGVAEFTRRYLANREKVKKEYPEYSQVYLNAINDADMMDKLDGLADLIHGWQTQGAKERIKGVISFEPPKKRKHEMHIERLVTSLFNENEVLRQAEIKLLGREAEIPYALSPFLQAQNRGWASGMAERAIKKGIYGEGGQKIAKGLEEILEPIDNMEDFSAYLVAKRSYELILQGKHKTPVAINDALKVIKDAPKEYDDAFNDLQDYQDALLAILIKSEGDVTLPQVVAWKEKYKWYVPFYRVFDSFNQQSGGGSKLANQGKSIKGMKEEGSSRDIIDPLESIVKNTILFTRIARKNAITNALVNLGEISEDSGQVIEKVPPPLLPVSFSLSAIDKYLEQQGIDTEELADPEQQVTIFHKGSQPAGRDNIVTFWRKGKLEFYRIGDRELYNHLMNVDEATHGFAVKIMTQIANVLRMGVTANPYYIFKNPTRDIATLIMQSDSYDGAADLLRLPTDIAKGLYEALAKGNTYYDFVSSGGAQAHFWGTSRDQTQKLLQDIKKADVSLARHIMKTPVYAFRMLRYISSSMDEGIRLAEYNQALRKGLSKEEAALRARDITTDFGQMGKSMKGINKVDAFLNPSIQGPYKAYRTIKEDYIKHSVKVGSVRVGIPARTLIRGLVFLTLPTVLLWMVNHDDDDYISLPQWRKDLCWNIPVGNGKFFPIPRPFEYGIVFATLPERMLSSMIDKDPLAYKGFVGEAARAILPFMNAQQTTITALQPVITVWANKYWMGSPVVPESEQGLDPELQYGPNTTEVAKFMGRVLNYSPRKIEALLFGYTGGLGKLVARGVDVGLSKAGVIPPKPTSAFDVTIDPYKNSEVLARFYDDLDEQEKWHKSNGVTGQPNDDLKKMRRLSDKLTIYNKIVKNEIYPAWDISAKEKEKRIRAINIRKDNLVRQMYNISLVDEPQNDFLPPIGKDVVYLKKREIAMKKAKIQQNKQGYEERFKDKPDISYIP